MHLTFCLCHSHLLSPGRFRTDYAIRNALAIARVAPWLFLESSSQIAPSGSQPTRLVTLKSSPPGSSGKLLSPQTPRLDSLTHSPAINRGVRRFALRHAKCNQIAGAPDTQPWRFSTGLAENSGARASDQRGGSGLVITRLCDSPRQHLVISSV